MVIILGLCEKFFHNSPPPLTVSWVNLPSDQMWDLFGYFFSAPPLAIVIPCSHPGGSWRSELLRSNPIRIIYMLIGQTPEAAPVPLNRTICSQHQSSCRHSILVGRYVTCLWWHHGLRSHYIARAWRFLFPGFIEVEWLSNLRPAIFRDAARCTMRLILITKRFSFTLGRAGGIFFSSEIRYPYNRGAKLGGDMTECRSDRDLPREFPLVEFSLCFTESSLLFICVLLSVQVP